MNDAWRVLRHGQVDSTNELALAAVAAGEARHGDVHVAREQTAGRGRRGARWESAPGEGLYASFVLLPAAPGPPPALATMTAGLSVLDAVLALGLARARLDWPNDVVVGAAKLAGILVETRGLDPRRPHLVLGVGLNVTQARFSTELAGERAVTSLALEGVGTSVELALEQLVDALRRRWDQARGAPLELARDYLAAAGLAGAEVRVALAGDTQVGRVLALDPARGLELEIAGGARRCLALEHVRALERV